MGQDMVELIRQGKATNCAVCGYSCDSGSSERVASQERLGASKIGPQGIHEVHYLTATLPLPNETGFKVDLVARTSPSPSPSPCRNETRSVCDSAA